MSQTMHQPDVTDVYVTYRQFLVRVACTRFFVPEDEAEALVQDVFLTYLRCATGVQDRRAWLVAAICNASRSYWRRNARYADGEVQDADDAGRAARRIEDSTRVAQVLSGLSERDKQILTLHYLEGRSAAEIACELETTPRYAEKLLHLCLTRVRKLFGDEL